MRLVSILIITILTARTQVTAETYGLFVSGGHPYFKNFLGFTVGMAAIYNEGIEVGMDITVLDGDGPDNTIAMYSDGDPPEHEGALGIKDSIYVSYRWNGKKYLLTEGWTNSADDYDRDGIADVDGRASFAVFQEECLRLQSIITPIDNLFVFIGLHGKNDVEQGYQIAFQDHHISGVVDGEEFAAILDLIPYNKRAIFLYSCHSGAFADDLNLDRTILLTSSSEDEATWMWLPEAYYGGPRDKEYNNNLDKYLLGTFRDAITGHADYDMNGITSWAEIYEYILVNDPFGPHSQWQEPEYPKIFGTQDLLDNTYWEIWDLVPGDSNLDGVVNVLDLDILGLNYGKTDAKWQDGDFNGDHIVDLIDLDLLGQNWNAVTTISEPMTVSIIIFVGFSLLIAKVIKSKGKL